MSRRSVGRERSTGADSETLAAKAAARWRRRFYIALAISAVLHVPLTPLMLLFDFFGRVLAIEKARAIDYDSDQVTIAVDLAPSPAPAAANGDTTADTIDDPTRSGPARGSRSEEPTPDDEADFGKRNPAADSNDVAGAFGLFDGEPNVTLELWFSPLRDHPLAAPVESLLTCSLLGAATERAGAGLDDLDAAVFAGPRLNDASRYTMAVGHHMSDERLARALTRMLPPHGSFVAPKVARIALGGATRIVFSSGPSVLVAMPEKVWKQLKAIPNRLSIPPARGRVLSLTMREPALPLGKLGIDVPKTVERMVLEVSAPSEGATLKLRFDDTDEAAASADAIVIGREIDRALAEVGQLTAAMHVLAPVIGAPPALDVSLPHMDFTADGRVIHGEARLDAAQVSKLLSALSPFVCVPGRRGAAGGTGSSNALP